MQTPTFCSGRPRRARRLHRVPPQGRRPPGGRDKTPSRYPSSLSQEEAAEPGLRPGHTAPLAPGRGALRTNNHKAECGGHQTRATPVRLSGRGRQPRQKHQRDAQRRFAGAGSCQGRHARDAEGAEHRRPGEGTETSTPCPRHRGPRNLKAAASEIRQGGERPGEWGHQTCFHPDFAAVRNFAQGKRKLPRLGSRLLR